jgi:hypothetical protein
MVLVAAPVGDASLLEVRRAEQPVDTVRTLLEQHDCWSDAAPRGDDAVVPGHVLVTRHGDVEPRIRGERAVHAALEQVFAGRDARMVVHGFCP